MIDQADLQGNVLCGFGHPHALHVALRVTHAAAARALLDRLAGAVQDARSWLPGPRPETAATVALSHAGLAKIGVADRLLDGFPPAFKAGMRARAGVLGDDPALFEDGLQDIDLVLSVHGDSAAAARARAEALLGGIAIGRGAEQPCAVLAGAREHFGFADGFAQPDIDDPRAGPGQRAQPTLTPHGPAPVKAGEFVQGYADEDGDVPLAPDERLGRSGTFTVVRKLHQDVDAWHAFLAEHGGPDQRDRLAALIVGRWHDGTPLAQAPDGPGGGAGNAFGYADDPRGVRCPLGAHVRRANPRDGFGDGRLTRRHRIIRRGMPYGAPADAEKGLWFVCHQASIERQFELVQRLWLLDGDAFGLGEERDPLTADADPHGVKVRLNGRIRILAPVPRFVYCRGGEYLFTPGIAALQALAQTA